MEKKAQAVNLMSVLKQLLAQANLTANGLAKILNLPTPTIHRLTTGEVQDPRISTLMLVANYFSVSVDELMGRKSKTDCDNTFSIAIKNNLYEPLFYHGSIVVINPEIKAKNGDYVLVNFKGDTIPILKRYISEGKNKYLSAVNGTKTEKFNSKESQIAGVVIQSYKNFIAGENAKR